ncbi:MAG: hypothetical protein M0Z55_12265 [Peptococcaceae bacterium]|nr:hypothetical protein [Peptococcaceae bacterium]
MAHRPKVILITDGDSIAAMGAEITTRAVQEILTRSEVDAPRQ